MAVLVGPTRVADVLPIDVARAVHLLLGCAPGVVGEGMDGARAGALEVLKCPRSCIELTFASRDSNGNSRAASSTFYAS